MDLLRCMEHLGFTPKRVSPAEGGEYASGCPGCGDGGKGPRSDRFHIWPQAEKSKLCKGRYWCRKCDAHGDTISFLQVFRGMSFAEACAELGIVLEGRQVARRRWQRTPELRSHGDWQPRVYQAPSELWRRRGEAFLADCSSRLLWDAPEALAWLAERGISEEMAARCGLGYNVSSKGGDRYRPRSLWGVAEKPGKNGRPKPLWLPRGWVIPARDDAGRLMQLRIRRENSDIARFAKEVKYLPVVGSSQATMVLHPEADVFAVVECGFDAILLAGISRGKIGAITTWNASARPDRRADTLLRRCSLILCCLDYDEAGHTATAWWQARYRHLVRPQPVRGADGWLKDPGDMAAAGIDLWEWLLAAMPRGLRLRMASPVTGSPAPDSASTPVSSGKEKPTAKPVEDPAAESAVVEVSLKNGAVFFVTDDRAEWNRLTREKEPVFSHHEIARFQTATAAMTEEERAAAMAQLIEVKSVFGGYVHAGRQAERAVPAAGTDTESCEGRSDNESKGGAADTA